jgi:hypothetical protein
MELFINVVRNKVEKNFNVKIAEENWISGPRIIA